MVKNLLNRKMSLEFIDKTEVLLCFEELKLFYSFKNELLSFHLSILLLNQSFQASITQF